MLWPCCSHHPTAWVQSLLIMPHLHLHFSLICAFYHVKAEIWMCVKIWLSFVPQMASPSLRYIMAVQNHLLSNIVLIRPDDGDDSDSSLQGETMKVQVNISFKCPLLFVYLCMPLKLHVDCCVEWPPELLASFIKMSRYYKIITSIAHNCVTHIIGETIYFNNNNNITLLLLYNIYYI